MARGKSTRSKAGKMQSKPATALAGRKMATPKKRKVDESVSEEEEETAYERLLRKMEEDKCSKSKGLEEGEVKSPQGWEQPDADKARARKSQQSPKVTRALILENDNYVDMENQGDGEFLGEEETDYFEDITEESSSTTDSNNNMTVINRTSAAVLSSASAKRADQVDDRTTSRQGPD